MRLRFNVRSGVILASSLLFAEGAAYVFMRVSEALNVPVTIAPDVVQLGRIPQGSIVESHLLVRNTGGRPALLSDIITSCGCTTVSNPRVVAPHSTATLTVRFDSYGMLGDQEKLVSLAVAGHEDRPLTVALRARVVQNVTASPASVDIGSLGPSGAGSASTVLTRLDGEPLNLESAACPGCQARASISRISASQCRLTLGVKANGRSGLHRDAVVVRVRNSPPFQVVVPITYRVLSEYRLEPESINFGSLTAPRSGRAMVSIEGPGAALLSVRSAPPGVTVRLRPISARRCALAAECRPAPRARQLLADEIVISTRNPRQGALTIPVYAAILPEPGAAGGTPPSRKRG